MKPIGPALQHIKPLTSPVQRTYSCAHLGVCQQRKPACAGCTVHDYPGIDQPINFAPGVIQRLPRLATSRRPVQRILAWFVIFMLAMLLTGFLARKIGFV